MNLNKKLFGYTIRISKSKKKKTRKGLALNKHKSKIHKERLGIAKSIQAQVDFYWWDCVTLAGGIWRRKRDGAKGIIKVTYLRISGRISDLKYDLYVIKNGRDKEWTEKYICSYDLKKGIFKISTITNKRKEPQEK